MLPKIYLLFLGLLLRLISAQNELGVRLDASLLISKEGDLMMQGDWSEGIPDLDVKNSFFGWTAMLRFEQDTEISDGQLVALARQGYNEMKAFVLFQKQLSPRQIPTVMTALHVKDSTRNTVYLGSSIKGGGGQSWVYQSRGGDGSTRPELFSGQLAELLKSCLAGYADEGQVVRNQHRMEASCGEVSAIYQWYLDNRGANLQNAKGTIVAWRGIDEKVVDPCHGPKEDQWGCKMLTYQAGLRPLLKGQKSSLPLPTPMRTDYVSLWTRPGCPLEED